MQDEIKYKITFLRHQSVDRVFRALLNDDHIRNSVDTFFLMTSNYLLMSQLVYEKKAAAYVLRDIPSNKCLGVFFVFRSGTQLYGHSFFRKHHGVNIIQVMSEIIRKILRYFRNNGYAISEIIGQIPEKNLPAILVVERLGAKYRKTFFSDDHETIVEYFLDCSK